MNKNTKPSEYATKRAGSGFGAIRNYALAGALALGGLIAGGCKPSYDNAPVADRPSAVQTSYQESKLIGPRLRDGNFYTAPESVDAYVDGLLEELSKGPARVAEGPKTPKPAKLPLRDRLNSWPVVGLFVPDRERVYTAEEQTKYPVARFFNEDIKDNQDPRRPALHSARMALRSPFRVPGKLLGKIPYAGVVLQYPFGICDELVGGTADQLPIMGKDFDELALHPYDTVKNKPWQATNTILTDASLLLLLKGWNSGGKGGHKSSKHSSHHDNPQPNPQPTPGPAPPIDG
jgi:hypothetical protein